MKKKVIICLLTSVLLALVFAEKGYSQDKGISKQFYIAANIPDSLKDNANSVVRYSKKEFIVKGLGKETINYHTIVTILNDKGDHEAELVLLYNKKYDNLSNIEMRIYNDKGEQIKKYYKSDMYDGAAIGDETMVSDDRFLAVRHTVANYPITVEVEYEESISSEVNLGSWDIQKDQQAIQNSYCRVLIDANAGFRYLSKNIHITPTDTAVNAIVKYTWRVSNLKAKKLEENSEWWRVLPRVYFTSKNFDFYGIQGDLSTWQNFGNFIRSLNADVCSLSPEREAEIRKMTDSIKTDKEKARFLYTYMQQNMRYVSIQLGIGGLKPFPASFVDKKKYGDCKALSNYMSALLKAVNIPSYYAVINAEANQEPADPAFPFNSFNHVILCVPFKGDTTWLECTSTTNEFGKLGSFTENRKALLITENGGKLVSTPRSAMADNQFNCEAHVILEADGGAKAQVKIFCRGDYRFDYIRLSSLKLDEQKQAYLENLNMKQPSSFTVSPIDDKNGWKQIELNLDYDKFCDIMASDKQFYRPKVVDLVPFTVPIEEKRKTDYYFEHPMQKSCVTTIDLPAGFEVETLPINQSLKFSYGNYDIKYVYDAAKNQVVSTSKFNLTNQVIPASKYTELQQYLDAVARAQNKKLVIRRKA